MKHIVGRAALAAAVVVAGITVTPLAATASPTPAALGSPAASAASPSGSAAADPAAVGAADYLSAHPQAVHLGRYDALIAQPVIAGGNGLKYVPYLRTYRGIPVVGGDFVVVTNARGTVLTVSVAQTSTIGELNVRPTVSAARAAGLAKGRMKVAASAAPAAAGASKLVVLASPTPKLAWESEVTGHTSEGPSKLSVYVDANSGAVLQQRERVMHGTGNSAYNGPNPVAIDTSGSGSSFSMADPTRTNLSCQDAATNKTFTGPDDSWGNGSASSKETGCVDALFAAQTEWKMLSAWLGRNGFTGDGKGFPIRVGLDDLNAYYDGSQVQIGHNQTDDWISSIDVVAHELGHAVDDHTPGSISGGGTQEFVADTFGAATEWYANEPSPYDTPDFTVGEEINLVGAGPIRVMYDPSKVGDKNCYDSSVPGGEVHAAAGPGNHWFYLLAMGSNPTNGQPVSPTCNSSSVTGIGTQKAITIMYNAMLMKTSSSGYTKYRTWTLTAAKNLYPGSCTEFNAVKAAWDAVSVPAQSGDPTCTGGGTGTLTVTDPGAQSTAVGGTVSLQLAATGGTSPYTWTATGLPAGLTASSAGKITGKPTTAGSSTVKVTAKDAKGATATGSFGWTVTSGGGGGCTGQKLVNPGFESGSTGWTASSGVITNDSGAPGHGGTYKAWMDGYGRSHTDTLSQTVTVPAGCTATLTFYLWIDSAEGTSTAYDKLTVAVNGSTKATYSNVNKGTGYVKRTVPLSGVSGSAKITFTGVEDSYQATSFIVDDTALTLG